MLRTIALGMFVSAGLLCPALAEDKSDFSGTWVLDKEKSDPLQMGMGGRRGGPGGPGGPGRGRSEGEGPMDIDLTLIIEQTETEMKLVRKIQMAGQEREVVQNLKLDGSENRNQAAMGRGDITSKIKWKKGSLINEGHQTMSTPRGDFELKTSEEFVLKEDGQVLVLTTKRDTPRGQMSSKQVFNRTTQ